ncbi:MAG TPA: M48 family metalloprotease [Thermoleophilaceae bacterium]|nr:M48 family metalloprotease [Thermoleophilaceae bacterium]
MTRRPRTLLAAAGLAVLAGAWVFAITRLLRTSVPSDLALPKLNPSAFFSHAELARARGYERFVRIDFVLSQLALLVALAFYARHGARYACESAAGRVGTGLLLGMLGLGIVWLAQLPFGVAELWWERRHGISHQGYLTWIVQSFLGLGGEFVAICLVITIVMGFAGLLRNRWWIPGAPAIVAVGVLIAFITPFLIPATHPLRSAALKSDARALERREGLPRIRIEVQDVHGFTTAPNAESVGLGPTRRVILWDTLLGGRFSRPQVKVVLAHELGHLRHEHIWKGLGWEAIFALPIGALVALATRRRGGLYSPLAVPLALLVFVVLQLISSPLQNAVASRMENEADWTALRATRDPAAATALFERLATTTLTDPSPPGWWQALIGTHPTIMRRIEMAQAWRRGARGGSAGQDELAREGREAAQADAPGGRQP